MENSMIVQKDTPSLTGNSIIEKRQELKTYFQNIWSTYEALFSLINHDEAYFLRPERLRHPLIFYFGHTATFYINKLILGRYITQRVNSKLEAICAVGVDEMSWDDLNSEHYDWPSVDEVRNYRDEVYQLVLDLIDNMELMLPIQQDSLAWIILMGCEHERIHLETSSVIMRMLPMQWLCVDNTWQPCLDSDSVNIPENTLLPVSASTISLGKKQQDNTFGWDNEYGTLVVKVESFSASKYLVSNQEYLTFVEAGGYQTPHFWCQEGQEWLKFSQAKMPRFWRYENKKYFQRNLVNEIPLPLNWPVEVNCLEAKAFCQWRDSQSELTIRLPTEAEWSLLRANAIDENDQEKAPRANTNLAHYASSCPVDHFAHGEFFDIVGNVWQWTESAIDGYEGFKVHPLYDDFSTPTFDGKHNLIKGGSWISTGNETLASARYAFRRHFFQHAGFRYVESSTEQVPATKVNPFEMDKDVCQQLACYFGDNPLSNENFAQYICADENYGKQIARHIKALINHRENKTNRLLNLGCSVGRVAFELSDTFQHIDAVDFSAQTIKHGVQLQTGERVRYTTTLEGDICQYHEFVLNDVVQGADAKNILFSQGDGCNLKEVFQHYDVIFIQHALEKSYDPLRLLHNAINRLNPSGLLIILSDYNYQIEYTEKSKWLSGIKVNGENLFGLAALTDKLAQHFDLVDTQELNRVLASSARNIKFDRCQLTAWQLK